MKNLFKKFSSTIRSNPKTILILFAIFFFQLFLVRAASADFLASDVIGQPDSGGNPDFNLSFQNNANGAFTPGASNNTGFTYPFGLVLDRVNHRLFVSDIGNRRVVEFDLDSNNNLLDHTADHVFGQPDMVTRDPYSASQNTLRGPAGLAYDSANNYLFVNDINNNRVMVFNLSGGITDNMNASFVIGQANFTASGSNATQSTFSSPIGLVYDETNQKLFVADQQNARVMVFNLSGGITNGMNASNVLGQTNFTNTGTATTQSGMNHPYGLAFDNTNNRLFVDDDNNGRILVFNLSGGISNGMNATNVIGQPNFTTAANNSTQTEVGCPGEPAYDSTNNQLYVTDYCGNRILVFDLRSGVTNGMAARAVLAAPDFTTTSGGTSQSLISDSEIGAYFDETKNRLYMNDSGNNRVLLWDLVNISNASPLSAGTESSSYNTTFAASSSQGTLRWTVSSGTLPAGLSLSSTTGVLSGTPTTAGTYIFAVNATDTVSVNQTFFDTKQFSLTINVPSSNNPPNDPTGLGPVGVTGGTSISTSLPTFDFTLSDPDGSDTVRYIFLLDDNSNFGSPIISYTSGLQAQGATSFTVGQAAGSGTYSIGSSATTLPDNPSGYYWKVESADEHFATSTFSVANSGSVAFTVDTTPPSSGSSGASSGRSGHRNPTAPIAGVTTSFTSFTFPVFTSESVTQTSETQTNFPASQTSQNESQSNPVIQPAVPASPTAEAPEAPAVVPIEESAPTSQETGPGFFKNISSALSPFAASRDLGPLTGFALVALALIALLAKFQISTRDLPIIVRSISDLYYLGLSFFQQFLSLIGLRQKRRYWGTVYDSLNKQPLDPAIVELIDASTQKTIEQSITDLYGRFGFLERQGQFFIKSTKTNYLFPSVRVTGASDGIFENVYHGEKIDIKTSEEVLAPNIPMDPVGFDWNQQEKRRLGLGKLNIKFETVILVICNMIFWLGFLAMLYLLISNPTKYNVLFTFIYLLMTVTNKLIPNPRLWGRVVSSRRSVDGLIIELSYLKLGVVVGKALTNSRGRYFLKAPEVGRYLLKVKEQTPDGAREIVSQEITVGSEKIIKSIIRI